MAFPYFWNVFYSMMFENVTSIILINGCTVSCVRIVGWSVPGCRNQITVINSLIIDSLAIIPERSPNWQKTCLRHHDFKEGSLISIESLLASMTESDSTFGVSEHEMSSLLRDRQTQQMKWTSWVLAYARKHGPHDAIRVAISAHVDLEARI